MTPSAIKMEKAYTSLLIRLKHIGDDASPEVISAVISGWKAELFPEVTVMAWAGTNYSEEEREAYLVEIRKLVNKALAANGNSDIVIWIKPPTHTDSGAYYH